MVGPHATPHFPFVLGLNLPWLLMPILLTLRLRKEHPFAQAETPISTSSFDVAQMMNG
jgi:hypothetical protein